MYDVILGKPNGNNFKTSENNKRILSDYLEQWGTRQILYIM